MLEVIARASGWLLVVMAAVTCFDVLARKTGLPAPLTKLQELEWHFHAALFSLWMGYGYTINAHPRVDSFTETLTLRRKAWIELAGCLLFALPYMALVAYYSLEFRRRFLRAARAVREHGRAHPSLDHQGHLCRRALAGGARHPECPGSPRRLPVRWTVASGGQSADRQHDTRCLDSGRVSIVLDWLADNLALIMFVAMFFVIFCGYPVAFVMGGMALLFALAGSLLGVFSMIGLSDVVLRMWGGVAADPVLASIPMFIFMGSILERSGSAMDMLKATEVLLKRTPGALAVAVMVMGTILAAPIGVVGAAVSHAFGDRAAADAGVGLRQATGHRHHRLRWNARHPHSAGDHAGGDGGDAGRPRRGHCFSQLRYPASCFRGFTWSTSSRSRCCGPAMAPKLAPRLRAADPRRVLVRRMARTVSDDDVDGDRDRLDLRWLGHADRERRRRRVRLAAHRGLEPAPDHWG